MTTALSLLRMILSEKKNRTNFDNSILDELNDLFGAASIHSLALAKDDEYRIQMIVGGDTDATVGGGGFTKPKNISCGRPDCDFKKWG